MLVVKLVDRLELEEAANFVCVQLAEENEEFEIFEERKCDAKSDDGTVAGQLWTHLGERKQGTLIREPYTGFRRGEGGESKQ